MYRLGLYFESIFLYGANTWTLTKTLETELNGTYTRMLRAAQNVHWSQRMTNVDLYMNTPPISDTINFRKLQLAGHVCRHKEELANELLFWEPVRGKNRVGRSPKTYVDILREETDLSVDELKRLMSDRVGWSGFIKTIRNYPS